MTRFSFPNWLELEAVRHIAWSLSGDPVEGVDDERTYEFPYETARYHLIAPELQHIWSKAKEWYPDEPAKGQIELFIMIESSLLHGEDKWTTEKRAEIWRKRILRTLEKLDELWADIPSNFMSEDDETKKRFQANELYQNAPGVSELRGIIEQLEFKKMMHGSQSEGEKAEKRHFIRELSSEFMAALGSWKRENVAKIATAIYDVSVTAQDVKKITRGLEKPESGDDLLSALFSNEPIKPPKS